MDVRSIKARSASQGPVTNKPARAAAAGAAAAAAHVTGPYDELASLGVLRQAQGGVARAEAGDGQRRLARDLADQSREKFRADTRLGGLAGKAPGLPSLAMEHALLQLQGGATPAVAAQECTKFIERHLCRLKREADALFDEAFAHTGKWLCSMELAPEVTAAQWAAERRAIVSRELREAVEAEVCETRLPNHPRQIALQQALNMAHEAADEAALRCAAARSGLEPWLLDAGYSAIDAANARRAFHVELAASGDVHEAEIAGRARAVAWAGWKKAEGVPQFRCKLAGAAADALFERLLKTSRDALRELREPDKAHDVLEETVSKLLRDALL